MSMQALREMQVCIWRDRALRYFQEGNAAQYYYCEMRMWREVYSLNELDSQSAVKYADEWEYNLRPGGPVREADPL